MKNLTSDFNSIAATTSGIEFLNETEMFSIRGGEEPPKPVSRPREVFDEEEG